jgi:hypothetical protein
MILQFLSSSLPSLENPIRKSHRDQAQIGDMWALCENRLPHVRNPLVNITTAMLGGIAHGRSKPPRLRFGVIPTKILPCCTGWGDFVADLSKQTRAKAPSTIPSGWWYTYPSEK